MAETIWWNVDTQKDFMYEGWALHVPGAEEILPNLQRLTRFARERGIRIVHTADWHTMGSPEISESPNFKATFPPHCLQGTEGARQVPETEAREPYIIDWQQPGFDAERTAAARELLLYKDAFSIFEGSPHTDGVLRAVNPVRAVVYGVATNVCVNYAVCGLRQRGVDVYVVTDAIKGLPNLPDPTDRWLSMGAKLIRTDQLAEVPVGN